MLCVLLKIILIFNTLTEITRGNPVGTPSQLACRKLVQRSAQCQITYTGWQQLGRCLKGDSVYVPDIERTITCTCTAHQPSAVTPGGQEFDSFTTPTSSPGPPTPPEQDETFPVHGKAHRSSLRSPLSRYSGGTPRGQRRLFPHISEPMAERGGSLADFDYVAPDGSVAMASRARPPGVAGLAVVVLAVLVAVLLAVVAVLCCSRQRVAALEDEEEEAGEGEGEEDDGESTRAGEEGSKYGKEGEDEKEDGKRGGKEEQGGTKEDEIKSKEPNNGAIEKKNEKADEKEESRAENGDKSEVETQHEIEEHGNTEQTRKEHDEPKQMKTTTTPRDHIPVSDTLDENAPISRLQTLNYDDPDGHKHRFPCASCGCFHVPFSCVGGEQSTHD